MAAFLARAFLGVGDGSAWNSPPALVELSAADTQSLTASWLPLNDPNTPESSITYQLHLATAADFLPDASTLAAEGPGLHSAQVTDLTPGTRYHARVRALGAPAPPTPPPTRVRALGAHGQQTTSDELSVQLPTLPPIRSATAVSEWHAGDAIQLGPDSFQLSPGVPVPAIGDLIVNRGENGYLKKVTNLTTSGGRTLIETTPAGLHDAYEQLQLSSGIDIAPVSTAAANAAAGAAIAAGVATPAGAVAYQHTPGGTRVDWPSTGFSLIAPSIATQNTARSPLPGTTAGALASGPGAIANAGQALFSETTARTTESGEWARVVGPQAVAVVPDSGGGAVQIKLNVYDDDEEWFGGKHIPIALCKVDDLQFKAPGDKDGTGLATLGSFEVTASETVPDYGADDYEAARAATQWLHIQAGADQVSADPYRVRFTAYVDEGGNGCAEPRSLFLGWKEKIKFELAVYVASEPNFPSNEAAALRFDGGFTVENRVTFSFAPELESDLEITSFRLDKARLVSRTSAKLAQQLTVTATGAASLDVTKPLIGERKFVKVFMAGSVPIVMTGSLAADLRIQGHTTGAIVASERLEMGFEGLEYGFEYNAGTWSEIKNVDPVYDLTLSGEADAEAHLTLSLLPRLKVTFYEALTGRLLVEPYLSAEAGIHGHVYADFVPAGISTDADYWLTKGTLSGGLNAWLFANIEGCSLGICKWPQTADEGDYTSYHKLELIGETPILGLPGLSVAEDLNQAHPLDSRAIRFQGAYSEVANPLQGLFGGPDAYIRFGQWTAAKVIALNDLGYRSLDAADAVTSGAHWIVFDRPGTYRVRLGGYSSLGPWARQVAETSLTLRDDDYDGMLDWWEQAYGIDDPDADEDGDGESNWSEFQAGTCPDCIVKHLGVTTFGDGSVSAAGIDCGSDCTESYDEGSDVVLVASPEPGATFQGWGGDCAAFGTDLSCSLSMDDDKNVAAGFSGGGGPIATHPLNDTGIDRCADPTIGSLPCPVAGYPGQDAQAGRDVTHADDSDGHAGFSFTKLDAAGNALPASATAWSCVRDNVTGLIWEVKTADGGLHDSAHLYSWYNPDPNTNGGDAGRADGWDTCHGYDPGDPTTYCNTRAYAARVNAAGLCGWSDWRLPSRFELTSILSRDRGFSAIDTAYFPNTGPGSLYWSSSPEPSNPAVAWDVWFGEGSVVSYFKGETDSVRLVRGGQ